MRHFRNLMWFSVGLLIAYVWLVPQAHAQTHVQFNAAGDIVGTMLDSQRATFIKAFGVLDQTSGHIVVKGTEVAVAAGAQVEKAAIAKAAAKIGAKAIPFVGTAIAIAELCDLLCPGGDYRKAADGTSLEQPEQPGIAGDAPGTGYYYNDSLPTLAKTPAAACQKVSDIWGSGQPVIMLAPSVDGSARCTISYQNYVGGTVYHPYSNLAVQRKASFYVPDYITATEVQTEADVLARMEQQAAFKPMYDAIRSDAVAAGSNWPADYNPIKSTTPVEVLAPPVTSPERTVSVQTVPLTDGTTETRTTTEHTTVTPTTTGTTVGDSKTTFPSQTVSTVTTINNTTNVTNTGTTTTYNQPAEDTAPDDTTDPCDAHPDRAGCTVLGEPPPAEEIPKEDVPVSITPVVFASAASCPAPINYQLYGARSISYQPLCDVMVYMRPLILALGAAACAFIFMDGFRV